MFQSFFSHRTETSGIVAKYLAQGDTYHPGLLTLTEKVIDLAGYKIDIKNSQP